MKLRHVWKTVLMIFLPVLPCWNGTAANGQEHAGFQVIGAGLQNRCIPDGRFHYLEGKWHRARLYHHRDRVYRSKGWSKMSSLLTERGWWPLKQDAPHPTACRKSQRSLLPAISFLALFAPPRCHGR